MLDIILNAHEVGLITNALFMWEQELGYLGDCELRSLREDLIEAWVAQNPEHVDLPWLGSGDDTK